ncbi:3-deoxy-D-manno-octulosonic acid kinase [Thalassotalea marina]|uniref:3-deoxy-D-manno-octulosonic acid kinase n=1 Tax=Thalassotalea marina TaxID=1673741 RepID=A0A919ELJ0_9GAMM|nr:3-deoxy-D-manno-octulosonic acid kinase [Thalassotalea marina]GHF99858.1 3-deoxy-D-manno-octulosonic acid kinase [Thalassotalea marina]
MNPNTIVKPCQEKDFTLGQISGQYDSNSIKNFSVDMLSPQYWQQNNAVITTAQGRGTTYFVKYQSQEWVLRHYYRGGLIGKIIHDSYLYTGLKNTRAAKEFDLLKHLNQLQLPAPKPIAYRVIRSGISYQADILTARIGHAKDLVAILQDRELDDQVWLSIGACIKQFHDHGIYHHDLNAHNILLDDNLKVWVIDFDQGEIRSPQQAWQQANMTRLLRSFNKEQQKLANFHWQKENWATLMEGYLSL